MARLLLIRGLPGSGKSTLAKSIVDLAPDFVYHVEADMYHVVTDSDGFEHYEFKPEKVKEAHRWCQETAFNFLGRIRCDTVIVSNTFTQLWEMKPYIDYCKNNKIEYTVITCEGDHGNIHGVPDEVMERMKARWEPYHG